MKELQLFKVAVSAFIVKDEKVLLLKRGEAEPFLPGAWEVPGGGVDVEETIEVALARETKEEAGLDMSVGRLFGYFEYEDGFKQKTVNLNFLCSMLDPEQEVDVSTGEMVEAQWVGRDELNALSFTSTIMRDACQQALIL